MGLALSLMAAGCPTPLPAGTITQSDSTGTVTDTGSDGGTTTTDADVEDKDLGVQDTGGGPDVKADTKPPTCDNGCDDGNSCTTGTCNEATGTCVMTAVPDGSICGVGCGGFCQAGACTLPGSGFAPDGDQLIGYECWSDVMCDDGDPCTVDSCDAETCGCTHTAIPGCGGCGPATNCDDGNLCTEDSCDPATGQCVSKPLPDGASCGVCGAVCSNGWCGGNGGAEPPDPGNPGDPAPPFAGCFSDDDCLVDAPCTKGICDPDTCQCIYEVDPACGCNGETCDDNDPCTEDICTSAGECVHVPLDNCGGGCDLDCDDGNDCTQDTCDDAGQCIHTPLPDGSECGTCIGVCVAGQCDDFLTCVEGSCDDGNPCTEDTCIDQCYCESTPIPNCGGCTEDWQCSDGDPCTVDTCLIDVDGQSVCTNTPSTDPNCAPPACTTDVECDDNDPCTIDLCADDGICYNWDDGSCTKPCTGADDCFDGDPCTLDSCVAGACAYETNPACNPSTPGCSSQGVIDSLTATWSVGQNVKVGGAPIPYTTQACTTAACSADDPCCNTCSTTLAIQDAVSAIEAYDPTDLGLPWAGSTDSCFAPIATQPPHMDSAYWVWGTVVDPFGAPPAPNAIIALSGQLQVAGWCIQTTPAGLPGTYKGDITLSTSTTGQAIPVTLVITYGASGDWDWSFELTDDTGQQEFTVTNIVIGDGDLSFDIVTLDPALGITTSIPVTLASNENTLSGDLGFLNGFVPFPQPSGFMSVTRQAPTPAP